MKFAFVVTIAALASSASCSQAPTPPVPRKLQMGCRSPNFCRKDENPVALIASAIRANPAATRFRLTWNDSLGGAYNSGTMVYDKTNHVLKFHNFDGDWGSSTLRDYMFTPVTDQLLFSLVAKYNTVNGAAQLHPNSLVTLLPRYGRRAFCLRKEWRKYNN